MIIKISHNYQFPVLCYSILLKIKCSEVLFISLFFSFYDILMSVMSIESNN